jgi:hypothetical protein
VEGNWAPEEWVGRKVKVGIRTPKGGLYWTLGWLQNVTDDEIGISTTHPLDKPTPRSYPRASVESIRPLHDDVTGHR